MRRAGTRLVALIKPALYFGLSLGVTFTLYIVLGIPVYLAVAQTVLT